MREPEAGWRTVVAMVGIVFVVEGSVMKKMLYVAAALVGLAACAKDGAVEVQKAVFMVGGVQTGQMLTKGVSVEAALAETLPSGNIALTLTALDGQLDEPLEVNTGNEVELPVGRYHVEGSYTPSKYSQSGNWYYMVEPSYVVDRQVTIVKGDAQYEVQAEYNCWALVCDFVKVAGYKKNSFYLSYTHSDFFGAVYLPEGAGNWTLTIIPADESLYQETTVSIVGNQMQNGKWYCFNPNGAVFEGALSVGFPAWVAAE